MRAIFSPFTLNGKINAPPSKSMAHRYLIGSALSGRECVIKGVDYSEDILASIDCLTSLGATVETNGDEVRIIPEGFMKVNGATLNCRESGSTLRFFIPLALCLGSPITLVGSERLFSRPLDAYEILCRENGFKFEKKGNSLTVCGKLKPGKYVVRGDISSQFITGLIFALVFLGGNSTIQILPPFESRSYIDLTMDALASFGASVVFTGENEITISEKKLHGYSGKIEGDYSNSAFLDAFNRLGSSVEIANLNPQSRQGDKVYGEYFDKIVNSNPTLDIANCPDLGPVLIALSALKGGVVLNGTARLKIKESDRAEAMKCELKKLGGEIEVGENSLTVIKKKLAYRGEVLCSHSDHRIVMALSLILSVIGGEIDGVEAVKKSYPHYFDDIKKLGAKVELQ